MFNQVDASGDGRLASEELIQGANQIRAAMGPPPGMPPLGLSGDESGDSEETLLDYINQDDEDGTAQTRLDLLFW
ncbi:MAG: hypothetical protein JSW27_15740 [Phycisphaerales bacterium]|nr:MAG: hypothetical protein JSW27_15740 [Phycisphaerales bacterium]